MQLQPRSWSDWAHSSADKLTSSSLCCAYLYVFVYVRYAVRYVFVKIFGIPLCVTHSVSES